MFKNIMWIAERHKKYFWVEPIWCTIKIKLRSIKNIIFCIEADYLEVIYNIVSKMNMDRAMSKIQFLCLLYLKKIDSLF